MGRKFRKDVPLREVRDVVEPLVKVYICIYIYIYVCVCVCV